MTFYRLPENLIENFSKTPESRMGLHLVIIDKSPGCVLSRQVLFVPDGEDDEAYSRLLEQWYWASAGEGVHARFFQEWLSTLDEPKSTILHAEEASDTIDQDDGNRPKGDGPSTSQSQNKIIGHLPFSMRTKANDVFYRFEHWPHSTSIIKQQKFVKPYTYAAPASELPFVPTGFAAVGRYALPKLPPACWRWEIQPEKDTEIRVGASVPLNFQSGGGVEVRFGENGASNRGEFAEPVVLPIY